MYINKIDLDKEEVKITLKRQEVIDLCNVICYTNESVMKDSIRYIMSHLLIARDLCNLGKLSTDIINRALEWRANTTTNEGDGPNEVSS